MYLSWITIGVLVLEAFWAGRLWQRTVRLARTEGEPAGPIPTLRELLRVVTAWEEEHQDSLEELSDELGGASEDRYDDASSPSLPLPRAIRSALRVLPSHVAALLGSQVWRLSLSEVSARLKAIQEGSDATQEGAGEKAHGAADKESPMRPVVSRLQGARDALRRLEGRDEPPSPEPLEAAPGDPVDAVPVGILALALIAANATDCLRQLRQEIEERLHHAEAKLEPDPLE